MESALYGINARIVDVSETSLVCCVHSFDFWYVNNWYVNNSCVNTVRPHFPWSILYIICFLTFSSQRYRVQVKGQRLLKWWVLVPRYSLGYFMVWNPDPVYENWTKLSWYTLYACTTLGNWLKCTLWYSFNWALTRKNQCRKKYNKKQKNKLNNLN